MEYFFPRCLFDSYSELCKVLSERGFEFVEAFHFNFFNTHPFAKFPELKFKFWNKETNQIVIYSIDRNGNSEVVGIYFEGDL